MPAPTEKAENRRRYELSERAVRLARAGFDIVALLPDGRMLAEPTRDPETLRHQLLVAFPNAQLGTVTRSGFVRPIVESDGH